MAVHGYSFIRKHTKLHIVNEFQEGMNEQKFKCKRVVFDQKNPSNSIKLVAMKIITNRKKMA